MAKTKVYFLDGGSCVIDGFHMYWNVGPCGDIRFPCYSVLVDHGEGKFLLDTSFDMEHTQKVLPFEKPMQTKEQTIPGALSLVGLKPEDITHVVNSHFHFDHVGGNKHLKNAVTICHRLEYEACQSPQPFERLGYSDLSFAPPEIAKEQAVPGFNPKFELVTGDQEIAKGLWLFETPGHSAGHYSVMVELADRRPMLFAFDNANTKKNLETGIICSFHLDPAANVRSVERLKELAEKHDAEIFYSHDPELFPNYLKPPEHYS